MTFEELRDKKIRPVFEKISRELSEKGITHEIVDENDSDAFGSDVQLRMIFPDHGDTGFKNFKHLAISVFLHPDGFLVVQTVTFNEMKHVGQYELNEDTENVIEERIEIYINNFLKNHILNK